MPQRPAGWPGSQRGAQDRLTLAEVDLGTSCPKRTCQRAAARSYFSVESSAEAEP